MGAKRSGCVVVSLPCSDTGNGVDGIVEVGVAKSLGKVVIVVQNVTVGVGVTISSQDNVLIVGSGFSFHNMRAFAWDGSRPPDPANDAFQNWLIDVCTAQIPESEREQKLLEWAKAPFARYCHPREEHLLPLHVCAGLAGGPAELIFDDYVLGKRAVAFKW